MSIGPSPELPGKPFAYLVFFVPLMLFIDVLPIRILGVLALAYVLTRPWSMTRRDPALLAFLGFSLLVIYSDHYGGRPLHEILVPFTGWLATPPYDSSLFFVVVALALGLPRFRNGAVIMCLLQVAMGLYEWLPEGPRESENPYLRVSVWQPVWTVAFPLGWAVLLLFTRPRDVRRTDQDAGMDSRRPTTG